jgi:Na+-transporting methylmalonyl-CoA/oxaloacetate decarboxylase gamma subunit
MSLSDSLLTALFCMAVVFAVLGILWAIIRLFSSLIRAIEKTNEKSSTGGNSEN